MLRFIGIMIITLFISSCNLLEKNDSIETQDADQETPEAKGAGTEFRIVTEKSGVQWIGSKLSSKHEGTINLQEGEFWVKEGQITAGRIVMDMNSITVTDLEGKDKEDLETHLKDTDFFETHEFPIGKFIITEVATAEDPAFTHLITGNLSLKGISKSITFPAVVNIEGDNIIANANFNIDRSKWGIVYKGRLDNAIRDEINLNIMLQAVRK